MGLLKYWFRAVEAYAPWVGQVHFITWGHLPEWLNTQCPKLHIVNHEDYIPEKYLPTFSANPIELNITAALNDPGIRMVCINDTPYGIDFERAMTQILEAYEKKLPNKSSFEK